MYTNLTYLHETSLMSRFLDMELIYHLVEHRLCYKLVKTRSQYFLSFQSYGILKTVKTSNLKAHNSLSQKILFR